jgi:hypothetical protein
LPRVASHCSLARYLEMSWAGIRGGRSSRVSSLLYRSPHQHDTVPQLM